MDSPDANSAVHRDDELPGTLARSRHPGGELHFCAPSAAVPFAVPEELPKVANWRVPDRSIHEKHFGSVSVAGKCEVLHFVVVPVFLESFGCTSAFTSPLAHLMPPTRMFWKMGCVRHSPPLLSVR